MWQQLKVIPSDEIDEAYLKSLEKDDDWQEESSTQYQDKPTQTFGNPEENNDNKEGQRNGWGILIPDEVQDEWPAYTGQISFLQPNKIADEVLVDKWQQQKLDQLIN